MLRTSKMLMGKRIILIYFVVCGLLASRQVMGEQELTTASTPSAVSSGTSDGPVESVLFGLSQATAHYYYTGARKVPELGVLLESTIPGPHLSFIDQSPDTSAAKNALHALIRKFQAVKMGIATEHIWRRPDCIFPLLVHLRHPHSQIGRYARQLFLKNAGKVLSNWLIQSGLSESDPDSTTIPDQTWAALETEPLEACWRSIYLAERFPNTQVGT